MIREDGPTKPCPSVLTFGGVEIRCTGNVYVDESGNPYPGREAHLGWMPNHTGDLPDDALQDGTPVRVGGVMWEIRG